MLSLRENVSYGVNEITNRTLEAEERNGLTHLLVNDWEVWANHHLFKSNRNLECSALQFWTNGVLFSKSIIGYKEIRQQKFTGEYCAQRKYLVFVNDQKTKRQELRVGLEQERLCEGLPRRENEGFRSLTKEDRS